MNLEVWLRSAGKVGNGRIELDKGEERWLLKDASVATVMAKWYASYGLGFVAEL